MGLLSATLFAKVHVVTTYPYLGEIVKQVGEGQVSVIVLANPKFDPHFIVPRPSLITKLRKADLLVINGGQLEIGWLPPLLRSAQNAKINVGTKGFLDVSGVIDMLDKPEKASRAMGDVHPDGNPHFSLDPHNIGKIAQVIAANCRRSTRQTVTSTKRVSPLFWKNGRTIFKSTMPKWRSAKPKKWCSIMISTTTS